MDFSWSAEERELRARVVRFAERELNDDVVERDRRQIFRRDLWQRCAAEGLAGLPVPAELGGLGLAPAATAVALEGLGYGCHDGGLAFALCAHLLACVVPLWKFGTPEQQRRYLPRLCRGEWIGALAVTEPASGSDALALRTTAVAQGDGFRIGGDKVWVCNAPQADLVLVLADVRSEEGRRGAPTAFLVERGTAGLTVGPGDERMGLRTAPVGTLRLRAASVPRTAVLGGVGFGARVFQRAMDWERVGLFACQVGTIERLLGIMVRHARNRRAFGKPIGAFQAVSHRLADVRVSLEAARLLVHQAAWHLDRSREGSLHASMAKLFTSEALVQAALDAVQVLGGQGYATDGGVERVLRDAVASRIYSGTSELQRNLIARWTGL